MNHNLDPVSSHWAFKFEWYTQFFDVIEHDYSNIKSNEAPLLTLVSCDLT